MKNKAKVLVDLSTLEEFYRGFGQVSHNFGEYFRKHYKAENHKFQIYLLMPKKMFGAYGSEVIYVSSSNWFRKHCKYLLPRMDVWHDPCQLSRFKPASAKKFVYTIHDLNFLLCDMSLADLAAPAPKLAAQMKRRVQRKINWADRVVCITDFTRWQVEQYMQLGGKRCEVIYNGVEQITNIPRTKPNIDIAPDFFLSISVFRSSKNFHVLLDMMKLMPEKHLYLAGNDSTNYGVVVRQRIKDENIANVHLLGIVSLAEKAWLYANCGAFLFPSLFEGFGLPVVEALQFGKPVVSSKETSLGEIGGGHVAFWEIFEPSYMKQTVENHIIAFNSSPEKIQAAKNYANSFSYEKNGKGYMEIYEKLV